MNTSDSYEIIFEELRKGKKLSDAVYSVNDCTDIASAAKTNLIGNIYFKFPPVKGRDSCNMAIMLDERFTRISENLFVNTSWNIWISIYHGLESSMYDYADITHFNFKDGIVIAYHYQCDFFGWHPEIAYRGEAILHTQWKQLLQKAGMSEADIAKYQFRDFL